MKHSWFQGSFSFDGVLEPVLPMGDIVRTCPLSTRDDIDPDVFNGMTSLGCFRDKHKLIAGLLAPEYVYTCTCSNRPHSLPVLILSLATSSQFLSF